MSLQEILKRVESGTTTYHDAIQLRRIIARQRRDIRMLARTIEQEASREPLPWIIEQEVNRGKPKSRGG